MNMGGIMVNKVIEVLKNGIIVPKILIGNYKKLKITSEELILIIYFLGNNDFDIEKICKELDLKPNKVLTLIDSLTKKNILKLKKVTNNNICEEYVCLDELYNKLALILINEKEEKTTTIYDTFEKEFGRTLSPTEYEIIGAYIDSGFSEELILAALKEAIYNGVTNLRYIDRILYDWQKKGIKNPNELKEKNKKEKKQVKEVFDYDWLNEND